MEYRMLLSLAYFNQKGEDYDLNELSEILGISCSSLSLIIESLFKKGYLTMNSILIEVSELGLSYLVSTSFYDCDFNDDSFSMDRINPQDAMSIYDPYVPEKFLVKLGIRK